MNFADPRLWIDVMQCLALAVIWLRKPGETALRDLVALLGRIDVLEERMRHMPTNDEMNEISGAVRAIEAQTEAQTHRLDTMARQLNRIEDYLLNQK